ncbi:hypothetical protein ACUNV4_16310 [Granulosicoccus sp. 3-233]|uniref:hypothetical protein n=1 Tax=Granulosicoccus sp. 3-233 TaxID=3417969 RepID=UPI003D32634D
MDLLHAQSVLETEDYETRLAAATPSSPVDRLAVVLPGDDESETRLLYLFALPGLEGVVTSGTLMQSLVDLDVDVPAEAIDTLVRVLNDVNASVALGHFGFDSNQQRLHYRCVQLLPDHPTPEDDARLVESVALAHFLVDRFGPEIIDAVM